MTFNTYFDWAYITALSKNGVSNPEVLKAIVKTPRERFVPEAYVSYAYANRALPIEYDQTISQPLMVALMTQTLELQPHHRVLEIGTGTGYQTTILSYLCQHVYTVERIEPLLLKAQQRFDELSIMNVSTLFADGMNGWEEKSPFDRIMVTAGGDREPPPALLEQLKGNGILVIPLQADRHQVVTKFQNTDSGVQREELWEVRFVPLLAETIAVQKEDLTKVNS